MSEHSDTASSTEMMSPGTGREFGASAHSYGHPDPVSAPTLPGSPPHRPTGAQRWWLFSLVVVLCLGLVGIGWGVWLRQPDSTALHVAAGTVQADLLTPDEVSKLAGTTVVPGPRANEPPPALVAEPSRCAVAVGPATRSVYGHDWSAFLSATYQDTAGTGDYAVTQVIGVYPDSGKAGRAFRTLVKGLKGCTSAVRTDQDGRTSSWTYKTGTATSDTVDWKAMQMAGDGWACYRQTRLKGRAVLQVALCAAGAGNPSVAKITDQFAAKVTG